MQLGAKYAAVGGPETQQQQHYRCRQLLIGSRNRDCAAGR